MPGRSNLLVLLCLPIFLFVNVVIAATKREKSKHAFSLAMVVGFASASFVAYLNGNPLNHGHPAGEEHMIGEGLNLFLSSVYLAGTIGFSILATFMWIKDSSSEDDRQAIPKRDFLSTRLQLDWPFGAQLAVTDGLILVAILLFIRVGTFLFSWAFLGLALVANIGIALYAWVEDSYFLPLGATVAFAGACLISGCETLYYLNRDNAIGAAISMFTCIGCFIIAAIIGAITRLVREKDGA